MINLNILSKYKYIINKCNKTLIKYQIYYQATNNINVWMKNNLAKHLLITILYNIINNWIIKFRD